MERNPSDPSAAVKLQFAYVVAAIRPTIVRPAWPGETWISLSPVPPLTSLQAYLDRIGLGGRADPGLVEVHRAHATGISFENFDPFSGTPVSLELVDLEDKIVTRGRGGYCFEHNLSSRPPWSRSAAWR